MNKERSQQQLAIKLAKTSLVLWFISLCLLGFGDMRGGAILYLGTLMGWSIPQGWAVYANYFYWYILIQILRGKKPIVSVFFMAILSLILPITILFADDWGWGWGAFLVFFCQCLAVLSALLIHREISTKFAYAVISCLICAIMGLGMWGGYQRHDANEWEYKQYFPSIEIVFTKQPLSGLPYQALSKAFPDDATIEMQFIGDIPLIIKDNQNAYPSTYWQHGKLWQKYASYMHSLNDFSIEMLEGTDIQEKAKPTHRLIVSNPKPKHYLYTLYNATNDIIYQQPIIMIKNKVMPRLYQLDLMQHSKNKTVENLLWQSDSGSEKCPIKRIATDNPNELIWQLDKRQLKLFNNSVIYPDKAICSANYIVAYSKQADDFATAWLFERKTGLPVATFHSLDKNTLPVKGYTAQQFEFTAFEESKDGNYKSYLVLDTDNGKVKLTVQDKR